MDPTLEQMDRLGESLNLLQANFPGLCNGLTCCNSFSILKYTDFRIAKVVQDNRWESKFVSWWKSSHLQVEDKDKNSLP